jgi:large repetitive protein
MKPRCLAQTLARVLGLLTALAVIASLAQVAIPPGPVGAATTTIYVKADASGANNGTSWGDAYTDLQSALTAATPTGGDTVEIWVAAGTYTPSAPTDPTDPRTATFQLKNNVGLYGGFAGGETTLEQRDWETNVTTLTGNIGVSGDATDNVRHVVLGSGTDATAVLDGFTVSGGYATMSETGDADDEDTGAGMYILNGGPTVSNCVFANNYAEFSGAGLYNEASNTTITNVTFNNNQAVASGGGMDNVDGTATLTDVDFINNDSDVGGALSNDAGLGGEVIIPTTVNLIDVTFSGNQATSAENYLQYGGAIYNVFATANLLNVVFQNNTATGDASRGGAMYNEDATANLTNVVFIGNSVGGLAGQGGAMYNYSNTATTAVTLTNVTISRNSAPGLSGSGAGIYNNAVNATITNSIIWGNTATSNAQIADGAGSVSVVNYSLVQGGRSGTANLNTDPLFVNATSNLRLQDASPAIDRGNNSAVPAGVTTDVDGNPRIVNNFVDMGAYENQTPAVHFLSVNSTTFTVGSAGSFSVIASGDPVPTFSYTGTLPDGVTLDSAGLLSGTPAAGTGGVYPITITATSGAIQANQSFTLTVNEAPAITSANNFTFAVGATGTFTVTATGYPIPTLSESGTLPSGVTFNSSTGVLSGTPAAGAGGVYPITFQAQNGVSPAAGQNFTLTVNGAPSITSASSVAFSVGAPCTFTVTASGYPSSTFSESGALPDGITFNSTTGVLSGTPAAGTLGTYPITFGASNGILPDATQSFTLTVVEGPVITSADHTTFVVGTPGTFTITASGYPPPTVTESGNLPSGVTLNSSTGVLSGTPAAGSGGIYSLAITADNGAGTPATQNFSLTVNEAPSFTSANSATFSAGVESTFAVTAYGYPTPTLSESGTLPNGVTFNPSTGQLKGTAATGSDGDYKITFTAKNNIGADATQNFTLTVAQGATTNLHLPVVLDNAYGGWTTGLALRNTSTTSGTYNITYYNSNGTVKKTDSGPIAGNGAVDIYHGKLFGGNWAGSATILADVPLVGMVNEAGPRGASMGYPGTASAGTTFYLPAVMDDAYGGWTTGIGIQNTSPSPATVTIHYYNYYGTEISTESQTIQANGCWGNYQGGKLGVGVAGSAIIVSDQPIVAIVNEIDSSGKSISYSGLAQGSNLVDLPVVLNNAYGGWTTGIGIQNTTANAATGTITYYNSDGTQAAVGTVNLTSHGSVGLYTGSVGLPDKWAGSAVVSLDQPMAVIVNESGGSGDAMGYEGTTSPSAQPNLPLVCDSRNGGWNTGVAIQNTTTSDNSVTIYYYSCSGQNIGSASQTIPAHGFWSVYQGGAMGGQMGSAKIVAGGTVAVVVNAVDGNGSASSYCGTP